VFALVSHFLYGHTTVATPFKIACFSARSLRYSLSFLTGGCSILALDSCCLWGFTFYSLTPCPTGRRLFWPVTTTIFCLPSPRYVDCATRSPPISYLCRPDLSRDRHLDGSHCPLFMVSIKFPSFYGFFFFDQFPIQTWFPALNLSIALLKMLFCFLIMLAVFPPLLGYKFFISLCQPSLDPSSQRLTFFPFFFITNFSILQPTLASLFPTLHSPAYSPSDFRGETTLRLLS